MIQYEASLTTIPGDDFYQTFLVGTLQLQLHFHWQSDAEEIVNKYKQSLDMRAKADPWINLTTGDVKRDYEWLKLYKDTIPHTYIAQVQAWLEAYGYVPQSLASLPLDLIVSQVYNLCKEADGIWYYLEPLYNQLRWNVEVIDMGGNSCTGVVQSGGWLNNQSATWRLKFDADAPIGHDDLLKAKIYFEAES